MIEAIQKSWQAMTRLRGLHRCAALGFIISALFLGAMAEPPTLDNSQPTVFITGSNRGIGLEFARQYAARGWNVIATSRRPEAADDLQALAAEFNHVILEKLDVTDHAAIGGLAEKYKDTAIDILINNAGILGGVETQKLGQLDYDKFDQVIAVNLLGVMKVSEAFTAHVAASNMKKMIAVTSNQGSIAFVRGGGGYFYRASKTALNMAMRNLALHLKEQGVIVGLIDPGAVDTDLMAPIKLPFPLTPPAEATAGLIEVIDGYTLESSGAYLQYNGNELPW